jgi:putative glutathione S-transferase
VNGFRALHEAYTAARPDYTGRVSVPVLWDRRRATIVNNESSEILRMFDAAFAQAGARADAPVLYPAALAARIDAVNARVYTDVNNGVYRAGFATSQAAYEEAVETLFAALDWLEDILAHQRYLAGDTITEADWRLFPTLARFDAIYVGHFKCNRRTLVDYPSLWAHTRELYQMPGVAETVDLDHIKRHYYMSHTGINPTHIVPKGPAIDFAAPYGRGDSPGAGRA